MTRKLVQIGQSLAVTLPVEVVKEFRLKKGQSVEVSVHPTTGAVTIRPGVSYFEAGKVTRRYDDAFRELAK
jgi:antitoxin component of MazEF toxin-antitoxin module